MITAFGSFREPSDQAGAIAASRSAGGTSAVTGDESVPPQEQFPRRTPEQLDVNEG